MRKNATRILFGLTLLVFAVLLVGREAAGWQISFSGWWTVFLIVPGLAGIIGFGFSFWNVFLVLLGGWLLANAQGWVRDVPTVYIWVATLVLLGLYLIFGGFRKPKIPIPPIVMDSVKTQDGSDFLSYAAVFGSVEAASDCRALRGGKLSAVFGGVELDLSNAAILNGAVIEAVSVFGGVDIKAPPACRIQLVGVPVFGGASSKIPQSNDESLPLLTVRYTAIFGGVEIV